ncbi:RNA polymerase sigma factor [Kribbella sp. NBC_00889]|uniref:RNA polymerase sigma factor n=1 Tax=Kribbella sp. NBC_00889 TaxID=2975974 RepID=UPI0038641DA2|nr:sigma-70 family RNA polymerase sigma factor [Kribbella sp. NBC_00889]
MSGLQAVWDGVVVPAGSERRLWDRTADGDAEAFAQLYDRHARAVYNFLHRRTASWSDAADLASAVFLQAWRRRHELVLDRDSALPWLLRTADYTMRNDRRSKLRYRRALAAAEQLPTEIDDHADDVAGRLDDDRRIRAARESLKHLRRHEREIVELCVSARWTSVRSGPPARVLLRVRAGRAFRREGRRQHSDGVHGPRVRRERRAHLYRSEDQG